MSTNNLSNEYIKKKNFLRNLGLKLAYVYKFLDDELTEDERENLNFIQVFRRYLKSFQNIELNECWTIEEEIENYRRLGFTLKSATKYVSKLKKVYTKDSTINWIYRIAESKSIPDGDNLFEKHLEQFDENLRKKDEKSEISNITNCQQCLAFSKENEKCNMCEMVCCNRCKPHSVETCYVCNYLVNNF
mgnify:FL=1|tara:strand:- start:1005 stop:1571 length:567 start_codon:yes stop_codon:yes gene_type:complete